MALIKVGAATEVELKEKKHRIEDAVSSVRAAIEEGVVAGGGTALIRAREAVGKVVESLEGDERTGAKTVWEAKLKEMKNYCDHRAIEAVLANGNEWNVMTCIWVLTWKQVEDGWKIKARLCLRGFQDRQGSDLHKYSPTALSLIHI